MRVQTEEKSVDNFITDLYTLAEFCDFSDLRDKLIRDRIVVGIRDKALSERLQLEADLTLEKAVNLETGVILEHFSEDGKTAISRHPLINFERGPAISFAPSTINDVGISSQPAAFFFFSFTKMSLMLVILKLKVNFFGFCV